MDVNIVVNCITLAVTLLDSTKEINPVYRKFKSITDYYMDIFTEEFKRNIENISDENIQEPNISVLAPTFNECIYYLKEEEIRNMFAKLVSASFDKSMTNYLHPGFIGIVKQLSPLDARLLLYIHDIESLSGISAIKDNREYLLIETSLIQDVKDIDQIALSINNLTRLGLIHINHRYDILFENNDNGALSVLLPDAYSKNNKLDKLFNDNGFETYSVNAYITNLGFNFIKVCIE